MPSRAIHTDVVIVGGGIIGCSAALHLRRRNRSVVLLERGKIGAQASGVNFGNLRRQGGFLPLLPLAMRSRAIWDDFERTIGGFEFDPSGHLKLAFSDDHMTELVEFAAVAKDYGLELEILDRMATLRRWPWLGPPVVGASFQPDDANLNPRLVCAALARAAQGNGVALLEGQDVREFERSNGMFVLRTDRGLIVRAEILINAAGAWAGRIAEQFGEPVPLSAAGPQMAVTEPLPPFIEPVVSVVGRFVYLRQTARGNIVFGGGERGPADIDTRRSYVLPELTILQMDQLCQLVPALTGALVIRVWTGIEGFLPDKIPVIGPSTTTPGLFHAFGFSGHGVQGGPAVGAVLCDLVVDGTSETPIAPFTIARFRNDERPRAGSQEHVRVR